jgi:preprotein translocase subunit SecG
MCGGLLIPAAMQHTVVSSCLFFILTILLGCLSSTGESSGEFKFLYYSFL